jgi:hypothetical protein
VTWYMSTSQGNCRDNPGARLTRIATCSEGVGSGELRGRGQPYRAARIVDGGLTRS